MTTSGGGAFYEVRINKVKEWDPNPGMNEDL